MAEQATPSGKRLMWLGIVLIVLGAVAILTPLMAGTAVVIVIGKKALVIVDEGKEEMSADAINAFFAR